MKKTHYPLHYAHLDIYLGDFRFRQKKPACAAPGGEHPNRRWAEQMVAALTKTVPHQAAPRREAENRLFRGVYYGALQHL